MPGAPQVLALPGPHTLSPWAHQPCPKLARLPGERESPQPDTRDGVPHSPLDAGRRLELLLWGFTRRHDYTSMIILP